MTNKAFEIQESTIRIGGIDLQAGNTGVVIPGVTRAADYKVEKVEDTGVQTYNGFTVDSEVVVVDVALYNAIVAQGNESHFADYTATTDGDGYIDDIEVNSQGTYTELEARDAETADMYAYIGTGSASDRPLVPQDWIQVPFRPKMRAGEVENIGGGSSLTVVDGNNELSNINTLVLLNGGNVVDLAPGVAGFDIAATNGGSGAGTFSTLPDFLDFAPNTTLHAGQTASGVFFSGNAGNGVSYPVRTAFTIGGEQKVTVTVDMEVNDECSDFGLCVFEDGVEPEWNWGPNSTRLSAAYSCTTPGITNQESENNSNWNIPGTGTYRVRFTYDPQNYPNLKLETMDTSNNILDTLEFDGTLNTDNRYRIGFGADQDNDGGNTNLRTYIKNLTIAVAGGDTYTDSLMLSGSGTPNNRIDNGMTSVIIPTTDGPALINVNDDKEWQFLADGGLMFPDGTIQTTAGSNGLAPVFTKTSNSEALLTGTLHLGKAAGGSITEWDSEYNTYVWFNGATGDNAGRKYAVGNDDYNNAFVVCFDTDGSLVWKYSFDQIDMNPMGQGMQQVYPLTVKHRNGEGTDGFIYVGYDCGPYCGAVQFDLTGQPLNQWFYTHDQDPNNASLDHHALEIDNNGNPILLGRAYGEWITYNNVTAQTGTSVGDNILVFNRSDLGNVTDLGPWMTSNWQIDIDGTGSWYQPSNYSVNAFRSVPITSVTGNGGHHTLTEGTAYTTGAIAIDATGTPFLTMDASLWTNTAERDAILAHSSNTDYVFKCAVGSLYQFTTSEGWTNTTGSIWTVQGSFSTVQGDSLSALTNISEFNYGGTATINVYFYINDQGVTLLNGQDVIFPGAGYNDGDTFKVLGSLLGGRDGGFITGLNSVQPPVGNTWYFSQNDLPTMNVDIPVGTYIRFGWTSAVGEVVSVSDLGDGLWTVETSLISGVAATGGSVEFYAGNDITGYRNWGNFYTNGGLPVQNKVRFYMDQSIADVPTYNVRASSGGQAFVIANNYTHTFGGSGNEGFNSASLDTVNNILYAQGDFNLTGNDYLIIAIDHSNGDVLWQKNYDDGSGGAYAKGIVADGAHNCVYVSWENDNGDVILGKISKTGDLLWAKHQDRFNNWNDPPQPLVDSNGDVYLCGQINQYDPNQDSWEEELVVIKLSGTDGTLLWSNSLTRTTVRTSIYEYYDTDATPFTMVNDKIYFGGYMYDRQNNYGVGLAIAIPTDGSGLGSNGDWEYHAFPNDWMIADNGGPLTFSDWTNDITLTAQDVPHPDALVMELAPFSVNISNNAPTWLVRAETIGGNSKLTFEDGSEFGHVGIARHSVQHGGGNDIWLAAKMNGQFIYFGDNPNNYNSTIKIPSNVNTQLPIGFTVTVIMNQFSGQSVYVNNDSNSDVQILANGNSDTSNWYWGFAGDSTPGVYTIMKIDTNVWMLAGPNVWVD